MVAMVVGKSGGFDVGKIAIGDPIVNSVAKFVAHELPAGFVPRARRYLGKFTASVAEQSNVPRFVGALFLSLGAWALQLWTFDLTARAAHFPIPLGGTAAALIAVNAGLLLRATPGNVGVFQAMYALAAVGFGMSRDPAIGVSLLIQAIQILPVTLLGVALAPEFVLKRKTALRATDAEALEAPRADRP